MHTCTQFLLFPRFISYNVSFEVRHKVGQDGILETNWLKES